jgi:hypothetical protein
MRCTALINTGKFHLPVNMIKLAETTGEANGQCNSGKIDKSIYPPA